MLLWQFVGYLSSTTRQFDGEDELHIYDMLGTALRFPFVQVSILVFLTQRDVASFTVGLILPHDLYLLVYSV